MKKASEYREHAAECRAMASRANPPQREMLLINMTATWEGLADDREKQIARQKRITVLDTPKGVR